MTLAQIFTYYKSPRPLIPYIPFFRKVPAFLLFCCENRSFLYAKKRWILILFLFIFFSRRARKNAPAGDEGQGRLEMFCVLRDCFARFIRRMFLLSLRLRINARAGIPSPAFPQPQGRNSPLWGDCSLSADLTADEIPAEGGHRRFGPAAVFNQRESPLTIPR